VTHDGAASNRATRWLRDLVRTGQWHRRLLASGLLAGAMAAGLQALEPPPPPSVVVVTTARDLPAGSRLGPADLAATRLTPGTVPDGAVTARSDALSRTLVAAARRGEPLTDVRLVGAGELASGDDAAVTVPVRIADADAVTLLRPGDVIDVLGAAAPVDGSGSTPARLLASAVRVVTVPVRDDGTSALGDLGGDGALLLVTTTSTTAARLAGAAVTDRLSVVLRGR
jgi:Flp pilus assembly protein CpaB